MKVLRLLLLIVMMMFLAGGCQDTASTDPPDSSIPGNSQEEPDVSEPTGEISSESLGGIRLGMSGEQVETLIGKEYIDEFHDEGGYFGEAIVIRHYTDGCDLVIGQESGLILQVDVYSSSYPTEQGFKVGDASIEALDNYDAQFTQFVSNQSGEKLDGWYVIDPDDELLIFSSRENRERLNDNLNAESKITGITLGRARFFD